MSRWIAAGLAAASLFLVVPTAHASEIEAELHPCHEYWPDGGHLVKWAEYEGYDFAYCMAAEILK